MFALKQTRTEVCLYGIDFLSSLLQKGVAYAGNNVKRPQTPEEPARRFDVSAPFASPNSAFDIAQNVCIVSDRSYNITNICTQIVSRGFSFCTYFDKATNRSRPF